MGFKVGIIGGTGLDNKELLTDRQELAIDTPFGKPSAPLIAGKVNGIDCVLLYRHGFKHELMPTHVNFRANMYAMKVAGCNIIVATTAVGSLKEEIAPGHFVLLDQFIDMTRHRQQTFYDGTCAEFKGILHLPMHAPFNDQISKCLLKMSSAISNTVHSSGTVVVVEGPRFSSKAESKVWRLYGADVINMTSCPEVVLANELAIPYAAIAMATDYDCWKEGEEVSTEKVFATMRLNGENVTKFLLAVLPELAREHTVWTSISNTMQETVKGSTIG